MDEAIINYVKRKYNLLIGERSAEYIKIRIGTAYPTDSMDSIEVKRDLVLGCRRRRSRSRARKCARHWRSGERDRRSGEDGPRRPRELSADIVDKGIVLVGGGSMLANLDVLLRETTGLPVMLAEDPLTAVAVGTGRCWTRSGSEGGHDPLA